MRKEFESRWEAGFLLCLFTVDFAWLGAFVIYGVLQNEPLATIFGLVIIVWLLILAPRGYWRTMIEYVLCGGCGVNFYDR